ncbi:Transposase [Paraburkholderia steynii]|uniref:Transposase n=1 Tax=Paraburkholderia steynii TaxID=1245441 RepID=A0A7Z7FIT2_9BURK|nr:Transposase [Paraburkholderia steynii]
MFFDELSNDEWAQVSALVSDEPAVRLNRRGRPRAEPRIVANAVLWILTTGEPWSRLPGRYPSGPTCRRRFEEWQANGTLAEVIRLLTLNGRAFAYIPEPTPPAAPKPAPVVETPKPRDDLARGVFWKSPETWQSSAPESGVPNGAPSGWRALAPMADITRQLAGSSAVETGFVEAPRASAVTALPAASAFDAGVVFGDAQRVDVQAVQAPMQAHAADSYAASVQTDAHGEDASTATASTDNSVDSQHTPLWMSLTAPRGLEVADRQGYTIYVEAEQVPNDAFRAWAEIMKDGKRVERSGLIGPRFADVDAAHRFALDWARQWIDRECRTQEAAAGLHASPSSVGLHTPKVAVRPVTRAMPELTPTPALAAANVVATTGNPHLPQHLNPRLMPLRRYPSEVVKDKTGERYPLPSNLLSHAG